MPVNKQRRRKRQTDLLMAPICSLPYDVLAEIFMILWAQSYTSTDRPPLLPTKLGAVSSFWRQVAWSTPRLWTELELTNRFWWSQDRIYILDTYFRNMGSFMLRLSICDYPTDMEARQSRKSQKRRGKRLKSPDTTLISFHGLEDIPFPAQDVFKTIFIRHPDKLRTVVMDKYIFPWLEEIENISESSGFPNLEVLGITSDEGEDPALAFSPYTDSHPSINIQNVPRLRSVVLIGTRNRFFLPWAQILALDLSSVNAEYAMQVVLECVNLQDLHVSDLEESPMDRGVTFPQERLALTALSSFTYSGFSVPLSWELGLVEHLTFPTLKMLYFDPSPLFFDHHADFLRNLPPTLEEVCVAGDNTPEFIHPFLALLPRLEHLSTLSVRFFDTVPLEILRYLIIKPRSEIILPALTHLTFILMPPASFLGRKRLQAILTLLRSRRGRRCPQGIMEIATFKIQFLSHRLDVKSWPESFQSGMQELVKQGLDIQISAISDTDGWLEFWP